jgi:peptidoglycan/LPS O-acetylase OafA/YrhL
MTAATTFESPTLQAPLVRRDRHRLWTFGASDLGSRKNGLNLVRLLLAYAVLVAHGWVLSGRGEGPHLNGQSMGGWSVFAFFAISGYLITGSRLTKPLGDYLVLRVARIFPAFIVCLIVTALVFAPVSYLSAHGSIDGFLTTATTPFNYVFTNSALRINAYDVAGTPSNVPYPGVWSGSLWTLYWEFYCYLIIAALLAAGWVRRRPSVVLAAMVLSIVGYAGWPTTFSAYLGDNAVLLFLLQLIPFFLAGSFFYMVRDRIAFTWPIALVAGALGLLAAMNVPVWGPQLAAPCLAYVVLWLGAALPSPRLIQKHDISYGVYIYAFPVQQLLAMAGLYSLNLAVYDALAMICTVPLAAASWFLVERPALRRARKITSHARHLEVPAPIVSAPLADVTGAPEPTPLPSAMVAPEPVAPR